MGDISYSGVLNIGAKSFGKKKLELSPDMCSAGMVVAETIYNKLGAVIINENTVIDLNMIKTLSRLGIEKISVFENSQGITAGDSIRIFQEKYTRSIQIISEVFQDLYAGKPLNTGKVNTIIDSLNDQAVESREMLTNISYAYPLGEYRYTHCINVSILSMLIARWLNFSEYDIRRVTKAGLLHDIGKVRVDKRILNKPGLLTRQEFEDIKKHVTYGMEIIENISDITYDEGMGILMHHEREDGNGYIYGLKGKDIHEFGKIIAVADVFDAMSSNRTFKKGIPVFDVFDQIETETAGSLDKRVTIVLLQHAPTCYIGEKFFLSNGEIGEIIFINPNRIAKPLVRVDNKYLDLSRESEIKLGHMI